MTFTRALATNNYGPAKFIVSANTYEGTHTTIASAMTAASSGDTIFIRPGTYTENVTLKAGVNITAYQGDGYNVNVNIVGKLTATTAGNRTISGVGLQTNGASFLEVSGATVGVVVKLIGCYLYASDATGITASNSSASSNIQAYNCIYRHDSTRAFIVISSANLAIFTYCEGTNGGGTNTASTTSSGALAFYYCKVTHPISSSGTGSLFGTYSRFTMSADNLTAVAHGGSVQSIFEHCMMESGTASAVTAVGELLLRNCIIGSSNAAIISGAIYHGDTLCIGSGNTTSVTNTPYYTDIGRYRAPYQPAFCAFNSVTDSNQTGDGTDYTVDFDTEIFDQNSNFSADTFTAPVTGRYQLNCNILCQQCTTAMNGKISINTSNRTWNSNNLVCETGNNEYNYSVLCDMDASDTAVCKVLVSAGTKVVDIFGDATDCRTTFNGYLAC